MSPKSRGRIVMLVDNNVTPDSRVQKQARSAAERGWDVTLLGQQRTPGPTSWQIGTAKVQLIKVDNPLNQRHHVWRSGRSRSPLAYARPAAAGYRRQLVLAQYADLRIRRARLAIAARNRPADPTVRLDRVIVFGERVKMAVRRRWTGLRAARTDALDQRRREMTSPLDRATTKFWQSTMGPRAWRRLDPNLWDWELAYGPVIDALLPDIIHANDFRMIGVGARAALRARSKGRNVKLVWDAHEFLPGMLPWVTHPRWHIAQQAHEREYAPLADAVCTVSDELADLLRAEHDLLERPTVVLNAPVVQPTPGSSAAPASVRRACGLADDVPLLVYSGVAKATRGLQILVEALPALPRAHVGLVVSQPKSEYVQGLVRRAKELGVSDRLHLVPYVPVEQIVPYLSAADIGVIPILHFPNHEISLITKFLEFSHARLPIVVSDVKAMSDKVRETGQGEVFRAEDVPDFVRAVQTVLADPESYRRAYDKPGLLDAWTWEAAANALDGVYTRLRAEQQ